MNKTSPAFVWSTAQGKKIIEKKNVHFLQNHKKGAGVDS